MRGILRDELSHGMRVRRGWRLAWYEPRRRVGVYFPPPLHWIARVLHEAAWRVQCAYRAPNRETHDVFELQRTHRERQKLADEHARGYLRGWQECFETCLEEMHSTKERLAGEEPESQWRH